MSIDFSKPVQTKNGKPVRILCTDRKLTYDGADYPVIGLLDNCIFTWTADGQHCESSDEGHALVNAPEEFYAGERVVAVWRHRGEVFFRVDPILYLDETAANNQRLSAKAEFIAFIRVKIQGVVGEGLDRVVQR